MTDRVTDSTDMTHDDDSLTASDKIAIVNSLILIMSKPRIDRDPVGKPVI